MTDYTGPIRKHFTTSYHAILASKLSRFVKKSVWKYILASAIISLTDPDIFGSFSKSFLIFSVIFLTSGIVVIIIGSGIWHKKLFMDADIEFYEEKIYVHYRNKELVEEKDWNWINFFKIYKDLVFIETSDHNPISFILPKSSFDEIELDFLNKMIIRPKK